MKFTVVFISALLLVGSFAYDHNYPPHHESSGGCRNAGARYPDGDLEGCAGIQLQHSGSFYPNEYIFDGIMDGISPAYSRMLDSKGYLRQAKCPYGHFDHIDYPFFGSAVRSEIVFGVSRQFAGQNLITGSSNVDAVGDWGNTTIRRRFLCPTSAYIRSPENVLICDTTGGASCPATGSWDGSQVLQETAGFENSAECLAGEIGTVFDTVPRVVANNVELINDWVETNPGTFGFVPLGTALAAQSENGNLVILQERIKCSPGWGYLVRKDDEDLCDCLTTANKKVDAYDYAEVCCSFRNPKYDSLGMTAGEDHFNECIGDRSLVNDQGGPSLPLNFEFSDCGNYFCERHGEDSACGY